MWKSLYLKNQPIPEQTRNNVVITMSSVPQDSTTDRVPDSTDSSVRYAAYASRLRTIALASHRYVAYTSDIGESFRPVFPPAAVTLGYGISWLYILGDVSYVAWVTKLQKEGRYRPGLKPWDPLPSVDKELADSAHAKSLPDWKMAGLERMIFQSVASMGLPAFTIHSAVKYSGKWINKQFPKSAALRTWGPIGLGLSVVPALPYVFDKPIEHLLDRVFHPQGDAQNHQKKE
ncbi:LAMI_0H06084g1_1 [Lachancea mirantina]|uniref:Mitochondrial fission process protein 1 n=1 Tax=Lachancea mirantina TaxID=1230905 RepID=A0A1G4KFA4_9SACH|nr:LAMI_0H06084g1_1 [Lachancea mirantina]